MANEIKYWHVTYNDIHNLIREATPKIAAEFNPDLLIAIGSWLYLSRHPSKIYHFFKVEGRSSHPSQFIRNYSVLFSGFFPARVMVSMGPLLWFDVLTRTLIKRTFLRQETGNKTLQIQAIGLSLYEPVDGATAEQLGNEVIRTQWL